MFKFALSYFRCKECKKVFSDTNVLKTHWLSVHAPEEELIFACDKCPRKFSRKHFLDTHLTLHISDNESSYFCEDCPERKA